MNPGSDAVDLCSILPRMVERSREVFWILALDPLRVLYVNPAVERLIGRGRDELYADADVWRSAIHPDDRELVAAQFAAAASGERDHLEWRYRLRDPHGQLHHVEVVADAMRSVDDGSTILFGITHEVTRIVDAQRELDEQQRVLHRALSTGRMGHWSFDFRSGEIRWSPQVFALFGRDVEKGPPDYETNLAYYHPHSRERLASAVDLAIATGESIGQDFQVRRDDGVVVFHHGLILTERDASGEVMLLWGIVQDITERTLQAAELRVRRRRAERSYRASNAALALLGRQLRQPLVALDQKLERWTAPRTGEPTVEDLTQLRGQLRTVLDLFDDVTDTSGDGASSRGVVDEVFEPEQVLRSLVDTAGSRLHERPVEFVEDVAEDLPRQVRGDPVRLTHLLHLLLDNALLYTRCGRITLHAKWIPAMASARAGELVVEIEDTGPGIPDDERERVFEPLFRGRRAREENTTGHGMGLSVARSLAGRLGAVIRLESAPPQGTLASVTVPLTLGPVAAEPSWSRPRGLRRSRRGLVAIGVRVPLIETLAERLQRDVVRLPDPVDLADQLGPDCDGILVGLRTHRFDPQRLARELRAGLYGPAGRTVPLVGLAEGRDGLHDVALRADGFTDLLEQDLDLDAAVALLAELLG